MASIRLDILDLEPQHEVRFVDVSDVAVDRAGRIYLLTRADPAVVIYEPDGRFAGSWRHPHFVLPHGITIDGDVVWVVDQGEHTARAYTLEGQPLDLLGTPGSPSDTGVDWSFPRYKDRYLSTTHGGPPFNNPTKLVVAADGTRYVSDGYGNTRVHRFDASGALEQSWGEPGRRPGEFRLPHSLCLLRDGRLVVADRENDRLQVFDGEGDLLDVWTDVQRPAAVTELPTGHIAVAELNWKVGDFSFASGDVTSPQPARVSVLDNHGDCVARVTGTGSETASPAADLWRPHGLAVSATGAVYVAQLGRAGVDQVSQVVVAHCSA